jgi:hypothetical protein
MDAKEKHKNVINKSKKKAINEKEKKKEKNY